jgi:hypothetical protein
MSTIKLKRSAVPGKVPATSALELGEIAINTYDGNIYIKKNDGTESIVVFTTNAPSEILEKLLTVDGAGSGLDADFLDGESGAYYLDWTNVTNKPDPNLTVSLTGDVSGTANATFTDLANASITITATIADNSHNHVANNITDFTDAVTNIVTKSFVDGLNVDADTLDGQDSTYYLDWTNTTNKPDPNIQVTLSGDVSGTANTTLTDLANGVISVVTTVADNSHNHVANNITDFTDAVTDIVTKTFVDGLNVDADTLDGQDSTYYLDWTNTTNKPDPNIVVSLSGDVSGTANTTLTDLANGTISITTTVADNSHNHVSANITDFTSTVTGIVTKTYVDGLNVDADTLDGQDSTYYLDWTNVTNKPDPNIQVTLSGDVSGTANATFTDLANGTISVVTTVADNSHNHTASNITDFNSAVTGIVTKTYVDGLNVDADTLDGQDGSYYLDWTNTTNKPDPNIQVTLSGDVSGTANTTLTDLANGSISITTTVADNSHNHVASNITDFNSAVTGIVTKTYVDGLNVDSDTLDGQQGSYYLDWTNTTNKPDPSITVVLTGDVSGTANTTLTDLSSGTISVTTTVADDSHNHIIANVDGLQDALDGKLPIGAKAVDSELLDGLDSSQFLRSDVADIASANVTFTNSRARFYDTTSAINAWELYQNSNGKLSFTVAGTLGAEMELTTDGVDYTNTTLTVGGNRVLTVADEGAGNGLDSDTLDGQQGSYYLDWTNTTNKPDPNIVVSLSGDVTGTANTTLTNLANGSISITTAVAELDDKVNLAGDTMTGFLTLHADPTQGLHAATKNYVDEVATGLQVKGSVEAATTGNLSGTYDNGTSGVGATLTLAASATLDIDGWTSWSQYDGILVKDQTNPEENGRYYVSTVGDSGTNWVLTRCGVCDEPEEIIGAFVFVSHGNTYESTGWAATVQNADTFTVGTDAINWTQFSGAGTYLAGTDLTLVGTTFNLNSTIAANTTGNAATATALQTSRTISLSGDVSGSASFDGTSNANITVTVADNSHNHTASNITDFNSAVTGIVTKTYVDGLNVDADTLDGQDGSYYLNWANVTNKPDPNIQVTLTGDVSGTANTTLTDLANGSISITTTVADDSHNHVISNVDGLQTALDSKLNLTGGTVTGDITLDNAADLVFRDTNGTFPTTAGSFFWDLNNDEARIYATQPATDEIDFVFKISDNAGPTDRFVFWIDDFRGPLEDKYPAHFDGQAQYLSVPVDGSGNKDLSNARLRVPFSGDVQIDGYRVWHMGNDGGGSGLDADTLDGQQGTYYLDWTNTTNKPDPTITLAGDLTGSVTLTDLANGTLTATVVDDSHNHIIANVDGLQDALDGKSNTGHTHTSSDITDFSSTVTGIVTKTYVDGLNVDADTLDGQDGSYYLDWTNVTNKPDPNIVVSLSGDVSGSANTTLTDLANGSISITTTVADNSHNHTASNITDFSSAVTGIVTKTYVDGLNVDADTLDGQDGSYYLDWTNTTNKPDPNIVVSLSGDVSGTANTTLTDLANGSISITTTVADNSHNHTASNITDFSSAVTGVVTKSYVDGLNVDADTLDGMDSTDFVATVGDTLTGALNFTVGTTGDVLTVDGKSAFKKVSLNGGLRVGTDDTLILGAGEAGAAMESNLSLTDEVVAIGGEFGVKFITFPNNDTNWSNRKEINIDPDGVFLTQEKIVVNTNAAIDSSAQTIATTTESVVCTFDATAYGSGKIVIQAKDSVSGEVQVSELLVVHDGTTASATEYGTIHTGASPLASYDVDISGGEVRIKATSASSNSTTFKASKTLIAA